jgi:threonine/homoserine/homoserine lactone efflux protein
MLVSVIRTLFLIVVLVLFVQQTRRTAAGSRRQRAFALAAGAVSLFALLNVLHLIGVNTDPFLLPAQIIGVLLLLGGAIFLYQAWRSGEMQQQIEEVHQAIDAERARREQKVKPKSDEVNNGS